nr:hypothetical protein [Methanobacterium formicicum]
MEEDESPEDFDECQCGGKLYYSETKPGRSRLKFYGTLSLIVIITMAAVGFFCFPGTLFQRSCIRTNSSCF